jgi:hypothetical protein
MYIRKKTSIKNSLIVALAVWLIPSLGWCTATITVPLVARAWSAKGDASFAPDRADGRSTLNLHHGSAVLKNTNFSNGVIDFDVKFYGGISGLTFHQHGKTADVLYFRPSADCATSDDCVQYMPLSHGIFEWDLYNQYQSPAPIKMGSWNHVKVILSGQKMSVFVNGGTLPILSAARLVGAFASGTIGLHGPAAFSNLTLTPARIARPRVSAAKSELVQDDQYIRGWQASTPFLMPSHPDKSLDEATGNEPSYSSLPPISARWQQILSNSDGLVDLSRTFGEKQTGSSIIATWIKTEVDSSRDQTKYVRIGWVREIWVFDNGKLLYANKNLYGIPSASKTPDGRLSLDNGGFNLPLHRGKNEIVVLIDDNMGGGAQHFGWGMQMKLKDMDGISFPGRRTHAQDTPRRPAD